MFDLEQAVGRWREKLERESSLSPREVDEMEDHLRAGYDLEMELAPAQTPVAAFANASGGMGEPAELSKEFARAGSPRWRRLIYAGWALFAVSFVLPVIGEGPRGGGFLDFGTVYGWEALVCALWDDNLLGTLSAATNLLMLGSLLTLRTARRGLSRLLRWLLCGAGVLNLLYWPNSAMTDGAAVTDFRPGYWIWTASFLCVAAGLWLRNREWASSEVAKETA